MWLFLQRKQILFPKGQTGGRWWEEGNRVRGQVSTLRLRATGVWEPLSSPRGGGLRRAVGRPSAESDASGAHKALSSQAAAVGEPQATWHVAEWTHVWGEAAPPPSLGMHLQGQACSPFSRGHWDGGSGGASPSREYVPRVWWLSSYADLGHHPRTSAGKLFPHFISTVVESNRP